MPPPNPGQRIDAALKEAASWELIDSVLLNLCKTYPAHKNEREVIAKVALIGRTYVTGVERAFEGGSRQGDALTNIVEHMHGNWKAIDEIIDGIPSRLNKLTDGAIEPIVSGHSALMRLLRRCKKCHRNPRAFVSKYLHFHRPTVPIYDSYVAGVISRVIGGRTRVAHSYSADVDWVYASYVEKFWRINQRIRDAGRDCTVKQIDTYLLWEAHHIGALEVSPPK